MSVFVLRNLHVIYASTALKQKERPALSKINRNRIQNKLLSLKKLYELTTADVTLLKFKSPTLLVRVRPYDTAAIHGDG